MVQQRKWQLQLKLENEKFILKKTQTCQHNLLPRTGRMVDNQSKYFFQDRHHLGLNLRVFLWERRQVQVSFAFNQDQRRWVRHGGGIKHYRRVRDALSAHLNCLPMHSAISLHGSCMSISERVHIHIYIYDSIRSVIPTQSETELPSSSSYFLCRISTQIWFSPQTYNWQRDKHQCKSR